MGEKRFGGPRLDQRLQAIAERIPQGAIVADIGADHGYLAAYLALSGQAVHVFACDVHEKPLQKAAETVAAMGVEDKVSLRLCDGLLGLQGESLTHVVIAGMGGGLIWRILEDAPDRRQETFVLQPMSNAHYLRRKLAENGFCLTKEQPVQAGRFVYTVMEAVYTGACRQLSLDEAYFGQLLAQPSPMARRYCGQVAFRLSRKVKGMKKSAKQDAAQGVLLAYQRLLDRIKEGLL